MRTWTLEVRVPTGRFREGEPPRPEIPKKKPGWRAKEWRRMLAEGVYGTRAELARGEGVSRAAVTQALSSESNGAER